MTLSPARCRWPAPRFTDLETFPLFVSVSCAGGNQVLVPGSAAPHARPMKYHWRDLSFDVDDALQDQTMVVLAKAGPGGAGSEPRYTLMVATDDATDVAGYVDLALREMATSLPGFRLVSREARELLGSRAFVVAARSLSPEGVSLVQKQAFVARDDGAVIVITGSAREAPDLVKEMEAAFDRLLKSLSRES